jgi:hypothetical protein
LKQTDPHQQTTSSINIKKRCLFCFVSSLSSLFRLFVSSV